MKICFFGIYKPDYSRNKILMGGLKQNGVSVMECRTELNGIKKYFDLIKKHWEIRNDYDVLLVAFPGWHSMILAKFLTRKPVIFDAFVSIYDSTVFDRKNTKRYSIKALYFWFMDWFSCRLADKILLDTNEHIAYFVDEFGIKKEKFERIFVGSFAETFSFKQEIKNNKFTLIFYGFLIPLQGLKFILETAEKLETYPDIEFNIVGTKIKKCYKDQIFKNVNFIEDLSYEHLLRKIHEADVCLGILGDTEKTKRVIPNKVYDCAAMKKPVITADTPAIREIFSEDDLLLIESADSNALKDAILFLKDNPSEMEKFAQNGYDKFIRHANMQILGGRLKQVAENLI